MFDKIFGPPPADLDDKRWKLHWTVSIGAVFAVAALIFWVYVMWNSAAGQGPGSINL